MLRGKRHLCWWGRASSASQLTSTYTLDPTSNAVSVGDIVSYLNGNVRRADNGAVASKLLASVNGNYESAAVLSSTSFVVSYYDGTNSGHPTTVVCTVSGTTPTCGSPVSLASVAGYYESAAALPSTSFVVTYDDNTNSGHPTAVVSTVSGTTITGGTTGWVRRDRLAALCTRCGHG